MLRCLREVFGNDFDLFIRICSDGRYVKWGYDTPKDAWNANPLITFD